MRTADASSLAEEFGQLAPGINLAEWTAAFERVPEAKLSEALYALERLIAWKDVSVERFWREFNEIAGVPAPVDEGNDEAELPLTREEWESLGRVHRTLRATKLATDPNGNPCPDPSKDAPLPRNRAEFNAEWARFLAQRYRGTEIAKAMS